MERLFGILLFLAFRFQYALEARLGCFNVFLFYAVRPLLEAVENLDSVWPACIQNSIPRFLVLVTQFINAGAYLANYFPIRRNLAALHSFQSVTEITLNAVREGSQGSFRVALKIHRDQFLALH
jgi:hypothetical protein